jgi:hypothetical protein
MQEKAADMLFEPPQGRILKLFARVLLTYRLPLEEAAVPRITVHPSR